MTTENGARCGAVLLVLAALSVSRPELAAARHATLTPTGTPADYAQAKNALKTLSPGDTLVFGAGRFDWSANLTDTLAASGLPGGLAITVSRLTVIGLNGSILSGATDAAGAPQRAAFGTNAAFRNAPGVDGVAIKGLTLTNFENGIVLIQADTLAAGRPVTAFKAGSTGWRLENLTFRDCYFGIVASGRHTDLAVRRNIFHMKLWSEGKGRIGSFAISVRPLPPAYRGLPYRVEIDQNEIHGPEDPTADGALAGIVVTADSARVTRNEISNYRIGVVGEGKGLIVGRNKVTQGAIGIVAWNTGVLGTQTTGAFIVNNIVEGMSYRPSGFLTGFGGSGILLAGLSKSDVSGNQLSGNAAADIVFGGVRSTTPSTGNNVHDNTGSVLLSSESKRLNTIRSGRVIVRAMKKPGEPDPARAKAPAAPPTPTPKKPSTATPSPGSGGQR